MPKQSPSAMEQTVESFAEQEIERVLPMLQVTPMTIITCGVNRKVNIGNYENVDVYSAITLPVPEASLYDPEALKILVREAAEIGFSIASKETGDRYVLLKEATQSGR